jgi:hypothetical protein
VNGLNQLTSASTTALSYDVRGNITSSGTISYTYDTENRLTSTASANYSYGLGYDPIGRYFWNAGPVLTLLFYDGSAHVEERSGSTRCCAATSTVRAQIRRWSGMKAQARRTSAG